MLRHSNGGSAVKTTFSFSRNTDPASIIRLSHRIKSAENFENRSIVLAFLQREEKGGGIKAMPRSYKSEEGNESTKLAKIVEIAEARSSISKRRSEQKPDQKRSPFTRFESRSIRKARRVIDF